MYLVFVSSNENYILQGGYDYLIGTSEHGHIVKSSELELPSFRYCLLYNSAALSFFFFFFSKPTNYHTPWLVRQDDYSLKTLSCRQWLMLCGNKTDLLIFWSALHCRHLLIAFGGLAGLEECIEEDKNLKVSRFLLTFLLFLFHYSINILLWEIFHTQLYETNFIFL